MNNNTKGLKKSSFLPVLIIAALAIGLYLNALKNGFVYDDKDTIVNNALIKSFDNLPLLFDKAAYFSRSGEVSYRPVVTFTYFIDYALYDLKPWDYHMTNVLLHAINGALLYIFLTLLLRPWTVPILPLRCTLFVNRDSPLSHSSRFTSPPFLISILFVTHPVLTEAVNAISYREDLLAFFFYMATLILYLRLRLKSALNHRATVFVTYLFSSIAYSLALLSKEMAATLPVVVYWYEWVYADKKERRFFAIISNRYNIGYIAITLVYIYVRFIYFFDPREGKFHAWPMNERLLSIPGLLLSYIKLITFPLSLSADHVFVPVVSASSYSFVLPFIILLLLSIILITIAKQSKREVIFGILFFAITLSPVYNIIPIANPFAERYLYLPFVGIAIVLAAMKYRLRYLLFFFLILSLYSVVTNERNKIWKDDYSLWSDTIRKTPKSGRAHYNLGVIYGTQEKLDKAIQEYQIALSLFNASGGTPSTRIRIATINAYVNLGDALARTGRYKEAEVPLKTVLMLIDDPVVHNSLGSIYNKQGHFDQAISHYQSALKLKPDYPEAHTNLGVAYAGKNNLEYAIAEFQIAVKLNPDLPNSHYNLGIAYLEKGLNNKARMEFEITLKLKPDHLQAQQELSKLLTGQSRFFSQFQDVTIIWKD